MGEMVQELLLKICRMTYFSMSSKGLFLDFGDELQKMVEPMVAALQDKH